MDFSKKMFCLITGANRGIGWEAMRLLASHDPNLHIIMGSRSLEKGNQGGIGRGVK